MDSTRNNAYAALNDSLKEKYSSLAAAAFYTDLINEFFIAEEHKDQFIDALGDVILGLNSFANCREILINHLTLDEQTVEAVISKLREYLDITSQNEIVSPFRTMADDMEKIHGYGAYAKQTEEVDENPDEPTHSSQQAATLAAKPVLSETPTYYEQPAPAEERDTRWDKH